MQMDPEMVDKRADAMLDAIAKERLLLSQQRQIVPFRLLKSLVLPPPLKVPEEYDWSNSWSTMNVTFHGPGLRYYEWKLSDGYS